MCRIIECVRIHILFPDLSKEKTNSIINETQTLHKIPQYTFFTVMTCLGYDGCNIKIPLRSGPQNKE